MIASFLLTLLHSQYVATEVYKIVDRKEQQQLLSLLRAVDGEPNMATLRGTLFEQLAHERLSQGGTVNICELASTACQQNVTQLTLPVQPVHHFRALKDLHVPTASGAYWKPRSQRCVAVDAILPPATAFQMPVSENHPIHCEITLLVKH